MRKFNLKKTLKDPYQQMLLMNDIKKFALAILQIAIIVGVCYVILSPVIGNGIVPKTIIKEIRDVLEISSKAEKEEKLSKKQRENLIKTLTKEMQTAARMLEFEHAAYLRDRINKLREKD